MYSVERTNGVKGKGIWNRFKNFWINYHWKIIGNRELKQKQIRIRVTNLKDASWIRYLKWS